VIVVLISAVLAGTAPVGFTLVTFCIFGAPHNFCEYRYFLSRLPSRLGPLKPFFITSFAGVTVLFLMELAMIALIRMNAISAPSATTILLVWNELLIFWILALSLIRYRRHFGELLVGNILIASIASVGNFLSPYAFSLVVSYVHPLLGLWILDRELLRTRKDWVKPYRLCLLTVPVSVLCLGLWLLGQSLPAGMVSTISTNIGSRIFASPTSPLFLGLFGFLQMVHYGIWVVAITVAAQGWRRWRLNRIPVLRNRQNLRRVMAAVVLLGLVAMVSFWIGFRVDYTTTNEIYVTVATLHVLAEIPFLFWMCES